jgi:hypothetical protein
LNHVSSNLFQNILSHVADGITEGVNAEREQVKYGWENI